MSITYYTTNPKIISNLLSKRNPANYFSWHNPLLMYNKPMYKKQITTSLIIILLCFSATPAFASTINSTRTKRRTVHYHEHHTHRSELTRSSFSVASNRSEFSQSSSDLNNRSEFAHSSFNLNSNRNEFRNPSFSIAPNNGEFTRSSFSLH